MILPGAPLSEVSPPSHQRATMGPRAMDSPVMDWYMRNIMPEVGQQFEKMNRIIPLVPKPMPESITIQITMVPILVEAYKHIVISQQTAQSVVEDSSEKEIAAAVGSQSDSSPQPELLVEQRSAVQSPRVVSKPRDKMNQKAVVPVGETKSNAVFLLHHIAIQNTKWLELIDAVVQNSDVKVNLKDLGELKKALVNYIGIIDKILIHYTLPHVGESELPEVNAVITGKKKINEVIKKMTPYNLKELLPKEVVLTGEDFLCEILGVNMEVNEHLVNIPADFRSHEPDEYYIKSFLLETLKYMDNPTLDNTSECLMKCGFTETRAGYLAALLKIRNLLDQQSLSYWVERYIDDMFEYDTLLSGLTKRYPYENGDNTGWFAQEVDREAEDDGEAVAATHIQILNMSSDMDTVSENEKRFVHPDTTQQFWYHGTDHDSARNIIEEGIQLRRGKAQQDFSDDDGFYLSENFPNVKKWAWKSMRPAVIIFKKEVCLEQYSGMYLTDNEEEWRAVVRYNRCGQSWRMIPPEAIKKRFNDSQFVYGPRCTNGAQGTRRTQTTDTWQPLGHEAATDLQLCIKSEEMAEKFGAIGNIEGVIFY